MSEITVTTARLVLRRIALDDIPALHAVMSDPAAMTYWSTLPHQTIAETTAWVAATLAAVEAGEADEFAVTLDGAAIGKAGIWQGAEVGVILSPDAWGQGYAAEALTVVIGRAFARSVNKITADIDPRNLASLRMFEKLGFRITGSATATFRLGEVWTDSLYLALTPGDWSATGPRPLTDHGGG
jgi:ribosomal-protein-alanine N-acetyltransferase